MKHLIFFIPFCVYSFNIWGQTNAFWNGVQAEYSIVFKNNINPKEVNSAWVQGNVPVSISDNSGEVLFYGDAPYLYNSRGDTLKNFNAATGYYNNQRRSSMLFRKSEHEYYNVFVYFSGDKDTTHPSGLYYSVIDTRLDNGLGGVDTAQDYVLVREGKQINFSHTLNAVRTNTEKVRVFGIFSDSLMAFEFSESGAAFLDATPIDVRSHIPLPLQLDTADISSYNLLASSHWGDAVYLFKEIWLDMPFSQPPHVRYFKVFTNLVVEKVHFDPVSQRFKINREVLVNNPWQWDPQQDTYDNFQYEPLRPNSLSLNDSFLYIFRTPYQHSYEPGLPIRKSISYGVPELLQVGVNGPYAIKKVKSIHYENETTLSLKMAGDGSLLLLEEEQDRDNKSYRAFFHQVPFPGKEAPACGFVDKKYILSKNIYANWNQLPNHMTDHLSFEHQMTYGCDALVAFDNQSNRSMGFDNFTWYFTKEHGKIDTVQGFEPSVLFTKNGDYPFKVYGSSSKKWGYSEYFYDTLKIRIPEKPVADFEVEDTVVCRYVPLKFTNLSTAKEKHPSKPEKYIWTFGDGEISNAKSPTHTYTDPGVYSVSLFYSNGYCDSPLTRSQLVRVVDAPKPGFSLDNNRGCSPFTVNFTDTVKLNTKKKEYFFGDVGQWEPIASENFSRKFDEPGKYLVVQRLFGYTGCVVQTDSVLIIVSKGLTYQDSASIKNALYTHNNEIKVNWNQVDGAVGYNLYRNNILLESNPHLEYFDAIENPDSFSYSIRAVDSCGNLSAPGLIGKPIFLTGKVVGNNEFGVLNFSPYQEWDEGVLEYTIYQVNRQNQKVMSVEIQQPNTSGEYTVEQFAEKGLLEKCYQVEATSNQGVISKSNIVCLSYVPSVYIPDAFSPNNDGMNDLFSPATFGIRMYHLKIYNRWGEKVYEGTNGSWNGMKNNVPLPSGVYFYTLNITKKQGQDIDSDLNGTLLLVR